MVKDGGRRTEADGKAVDGEWLMGKSEGEKTNS